MQLGDARRGGWLEQKTRNLSCWGSVLANAKQGASVSGRGDLGGVGEVQLWRMEVVIRLVSSRGVGFAHLVTLSPLSLSYPFPTPKPTL